MSSIAFFDLEIGSQGGGQKNGKILDVGNITDAVTIERLLLKRKIARFVIDEADCFSSRGQDFRVDYLYIGEDMRDYFKRKLDIELDVFRATTSRPT